MAEKQTIDAMWGDSPVDVSTEAASFLGSCRYKLPEISEDKAIYEKIFAILEELLDCFFLLFITEFVIVHQILQVLHQLFFCRFLLSL